MSKKQLTDKEIITGLCFKSGVLMGFIQRHGLYEEFKKEFGEEFSAGIYSLLKGERIRAEPIQEEYRELMNVLAHTLNKALNGDLKGSDRHTGFALFVFPFGEAENGRCNYISNGADRKAMVCLMKEMIARFEGQPEIVGNA